MWLKTGEVRAREVAAQRAGRDVEFAGQPTDGETDGVFDEGEFTTEVLAGRDASGVGMSRVVEQGHRQGRGVRLRGQHSEGRTTELSEPVWTYRIRLEPARRAAITWEPLATSGGRTRHDG